MSWPDELAEALGEEPLSPAETATVLDVARDVAHNAERRAAPLSTYLLGLAVGRDDDGRGDRLEALVAQTRHLLGLDEES